jgi:hypothetical protein
MKRAIAKLDGWDAMAAAGLLLLAYGAGKIAPAYGWITLGSGLLYLALFHDLVTATMGRRHGPDRT